ncbi:SURF1 family protein [Microbacter sp. GSS18]|nr:SURF1 family protein [Microbacter sp. GSS18]
MSMQNLPKAGRWAIYIALAVVFAIACAFLANWQFARNEERTGQIDLVEANFDADPLPLAEAIPAGSAFDPADQWQPVVLTGRYLADEQLLARNRAHSGTSAFEVLVPFALDDGRVFLVDRGWLLPGSQSPLPDDIPAPPSGDVTVIARLQPGEPLPRSGRSAPEGQVPTINLPLVAEELGAEAGDAMIVDAYGILLSEDPSPASAPNAIEDPSQDPGPHLSYAIQWILFAIMGFVFIGYVIRTEIQHRREDAAEDAERTVEPAPARAEVPVAKPRRRRDRDADDEDALLDAAGRR